MVNLEQLSEVPVTFYAALEDKRCPYSINKRVYESLGSDKTWFVNMQGDQNFFS